MVTTSGGNSQAGSGPQTAEWSGWRAAAVRGLHCCCCDCSLPENRRSQISRSLWSNSYFAYSLWAYCWRSSCSMAADLFLVGDKRWR